LGLRADCNPFVDSHRFLWVEKLPTPFYIIVF